MKELSSVINKLKKVLETVKDPTTYDTLNSFIDELESELEMQEAEFSGYFKES